MPRTLVTRASMTLVLTTLMLTPLFVVGPASVACGSPHLSVSNGATSTGGVYVVYKAQIVTIHGSDWSSCTEQVGGCIRPSRPAPISSIRLELVRARGGRGDAPPSSWRPARRVVHVGNVGAADDYTFSIDQVTMPTRHGHYMLIARDPTSRQPMATTYITVL